MVHWYIQLQCLIRSGSLGGSSVRDVLGGPNVFEDVWFCRCIAKKCSLLFALLKTIYKRRNNNTVSLFPNWNTVAGEWPQKNTVPSLKSYK